MSASGQESSFARPQEGSGCRSCLALDVPKIVPGTQVIEVASGDLDGDGAADLAALVHGPAPDESFFIVVLRAQGAGFVEWARSADVGPAARALDRARISADAPRAQSGRNCSARLRVFPVVTFPVCNVLLRSISISRHSSSATGLWRTPLGTT